MRGETIFNTLRFAGMTAAGACGLMGNMQAESTMKANIAQRGMTSLSDEAYTEAADNGLIDFVHDAVGYGLCQWTLSTRKAELLRYAQSRGLSVGDEDMQVAFCIMELRRDFPALNELLRSSHDIEECSDRVCDTYERPAVNNYEARRRFAREFYDRFAVSEPPANIGAAITEKLRDSSEPPDFYNLDVLEIQTVMCRNGYWSRPDGYKSPAFFEALRRFVDDMESC